MTSEDFIKALVGLDEEKALELARERIEKGDDPLKILEDMRKAADKIGKKFEDGEYFVSDLILTGEIFNEIMEMLKPLIKKKKVKRKGKVVAGTVEGDIHDIGKNIVIALLEAEGFEVIDIGVDQPPEAFIEAIKKHKPDIVSLSGLLTEAIESMKNTIDAIKEAGLRDKVKIIVGGGRTNEEVKEYTEADEWADDAATGVKKMKKLIGAD
ncbi:B12-binding domain-containing protein [Methanothermobacter tenebrarum]|uniref:Cobalamin-binding protein n=1 Tax=Methanothermobacter tenebrarum TaxID=680118 RepID=A0A328PGY0_9EURY|nr:cobalamin-dependent protein [Methanothermobacter tenebrarum]MBC7101469.1 cobalamin B12-binding domain-containing protein [Methanobacteriales archaeon]MBC7117948.1 cobalamin B12-binding domain-containing protein [Methanobacteriaceae archaeon]NPV64596.1 cobalamin-binding protein [Methanobacteriaceae archaeon]RAO78674.1 cobalamin-binding protein [Methanothermobacter tenebrarum]